MIMQSMKLLLLMTVVTVIGSCGEDSIMPRAQLVVSPNVISIKRNQNAQIQVQLDDPHKIYQDLDLELAFKDSYTGIKVEFQKPTLRNQDIVIVTISVDGNAEANRKYGLGIGGKLNGAYKAGVFLGLTVEP
jgi:hypothetical protein